MLLNRYASCHLLCPWINHSTLPFLIDPGSDSGMEIREAIPEEQDRPGLPHSHSTDHLPSFPAWVPTQLASLPTISPLQSLLHTWRHSFISKPLSRTYHVPGMVLGVGHREVKETDHVPTPQNLISWWREQTPPHTHTQKKQEQQI